MDAERTLALIEKAAEYRAKLTEMKEKADAIREELLKPIRKKLDRVDAEFDRLAIPVLDKIASLDERIKARVVEHGETLRTETLMAVYTKPKVSWDAAMLTGMAAIIPEVAKARTVAEFGTCYLREIKPKD